MRPLLAVSRSCSCRNTGFTLAEVLISVAVMSMLLSSLCGVYFATTQEWQRQSGQNDALVATSQACTRMSDYISQATGAVVVTRFFTNDTLALNMPADSANGVYSPIWSGGKIQYRSGNWICFYLSDSTGSVNVNGSILWHGTVSWASGTYTVTPDTAASLYYNSTKGRIAPLMSIKFALNESGARPYVTATVVSSFTTGRTSKQTSMSTSVCLRNTN